MSDSPSSSSPTSSAPVATTDTSTSEVSASGASPQLTKPAASPTAPNSKHADKAAALPAPGEETPAEKKRRTLKLKVDGKEEEVDVDGMDDAELATHIQMSKAARKRMQEAADHRKELESYKSQFQQLKELGKSSPQEALEKLFGVNPREFAENYLKGIYSEEAMPEGERKHLQLQRELEAREAKIREYEEEKSRAVKEAEEARLSESRAAQDKIVHEEYQRSFAEALEVSGLPNTRETLFEMAKIAKLNLQHGIELTPQQMAHEVKKRLSGTTQAVFKNLKGAALESYLGADVVKEIVRMSVEKVRSAKKPAFSAPAASKSLKSDASKEEAIRNQRLDMKKFFRGE